MKDLSELMLLSGPPQYPVAGEKAPHRGGTRLSLSGDHVGLAWRLVGFPVAAPAPRDEDRGMKTASPVGGGVDAEAQSSEYLKECDSRPSGLGP